jgi:hypothetical protein
MSETVDLRPATEADVPRLAELYMELIQFRGPVELEAVWVNISESTALK